MDQRQLVIAQRQRDPEVVDGRSGGGLQPTGPQHALKRGIKGLDPIASGNQNKRVARSFFGSRGVGRSECCRYGTVIGQARIDRPARSRRQAEAEPGEYGSEAYSLHTTAIGRIHELFSSRWQSGRGATRSTEMSTSLGH